MRDWALVLSAIVAFGLAGPAAAQSASHPPCAQINDYGGDPTGANDNTAALASAWSVSSASGQYCVEFAAGTYKFTAPITYSFAANGQSLTLVGQGQGTTVLVWPSTDGLTVNYVNQGDQVTIKGATFETGTTGKIALTLYQPKTPNVGLSVPNTLSELSFQGVSSPSNAWLNAVKVFAVNNVNFDHFQCLQITNQAASYGYGTCIYLTGWAPTMTNGMDYQYGVIYNFTHLNVWAAQYGVWQDQYVQGVNISNGCNFTAGNYGVYSPSVAGPYQLTVDGCQFNVFNWAIFDNSYGTTGETLVHNTIIIQNGTTGGGIYVGDCKLCNVSDNNFAGNSGATPPAVVGGVTGIEIQVSNADVPAGIIRGNAFAYIDTGVLLQAGTAGILNYANVYYAVNHPFTTYSSSNFNGTTCSGAPTSSFFSASGIITHC